MMCTSLKQDYKDLIILCWCADGGSDYSVDFFKAVLSMLSYNLFCLSKSAMDIKAIMPVQLSCWRQYSNQDCVGRAADFPELLNLEVIKLNLFKKENIEHNYSKVCINIVASNVNIFIEKETLF